MTNTGNSSKGDNIPKLLGNLLLDTLYFITPVAENEVLDPPVLCLTPNDERQVFIDEWENDGLEAHLFIIRQDSSAPYSFYLKNILSGKDIIPVSSSGSSVIDAYVDGVAGYSATTVFKQINSDEYCILNPDSDLYLTAPEKIAAGFAVEYAESKTNKKKQKWKFVKPAIRHI
jgi:hypothetical protein